MLKKEPNYQFKGSTSETINNMLSLLYGKEQYGDTILYSYFVNEDQPVHYKNKMTEILKKMQKENLICTRLDAVGGKHDTGNTGEIRVAIREQGKELLAKGGYSTAQDSSIDSDILAGTNIRFKYGSIVAIVLSVIAAIWFIIS